MAFLGPQRTAQAHDLTGQLLGKLDPTKRVYLRHDFGSDVVPSSKVKGTSDPQVTNSFDPHFVRSGQGTATANAHSGGGVKLVASSGTSKTAFGAAVKPRVNSPWTDYKWNTDNEIAFECLFATGANVTAARFAAGFMLTPNANTTTDADQIKLWYSTAAGAVAVNFKIAMSYGGTDITAVDTGVTAVANTVYHFAVAVDSTLLAHWAITNAAGSTGASGALSTKMSSATNLIPIAGLAAGTVGAAASVSWFLYRISCSMNAYVS